MWEAGRRRWISNDTHGMLNVTYDPMFVIMLTSSRLFTVLDCISRIAFTCGKIEIPSPNSMFHTALQSLPSIQTLTVTPRWLSYSPSYLTLSSVSSSPIPYPSQQNNPPPSLPNPTPNLTSLHSRHTTSPRHTTKSAELRPSITTNKYNFQIPTPQ